MFTMNGRDVLKMSKKGTLYVIGSVSFPREHAGASRLIEFSDILKNSFDKIILAGKFENKPHEYYKFEDNIYFLPFHTISIKNIFDKIQLLFFPHKLFLDDLIKCIETNNVTHILIYSVLPSYSVRRVLKIAKTHNIKIVFDVVEFQSLSEQTLSTTFSFYLPNLILNKYLIKKQDVITISSYLQNYFMLKGCRTITIPFIFNSSKKPAPIINNTNDLSIKILYAGSPNKSKDLILNCIKGLSLLPANIMRNFKFFIAGPEEIKIKRLIPEKIYKNIQKQVIFLGRISNNDVIKLYNSCDFSVLLRDEKKRLAKAGFPTKVSESLVHGVPVLCNLSSDLDKYLIDGVNSVIVHGHSANDFKNSLLSVSKMSRQELNSMKINARKLFEEKLDSSLFKKDLIDFFDN